MLISPSYREANRQLHATREKYGLASGAQWAAYVEQLVTDEGHRTVLDYGAGKGSLAKTLAEVGIAVVEYDPAIEGKDLEPEAAELVVCVDVLEHIEPDCLDAVLAHLAQLTQRKLLVDICIVPAHKTLPDGRNAHLIVESPEWWKAKLEQHFDFASWTVRPECSFLYGELLPKGSPPIVPLRKRRKMAPDHSAMINKLKEKQNACASAWSRIRTVKCFDYLPGDEVADMQVAFDLLDDVKTEDLDTVLHALWKLGRKAVLIRALLTPERTEAFWREKFEQRWELADSHQDGASFGMVGIPKVSVYGVKTVAAVETDERWTHVQAAMARITKRLPLADVRQGKAVIACYGPSLGETIERLRYEATEEPDTVVVSVSGAHDFLIEHGIVPTYHIECDPRPHKALNINAGHPSVKYLLGSVCHPVVFDKLSGCDVSLFHVTDLNHVKKLLDLGENGHHIINGGGSVGLFSLPVMYSLGYRDYSIYAMDCSFADAEQQWAGKHAGKRKEVSYVSCGGRTFCTAPVLLSYAADFIAMVQSVSDATFRVYGDGLLQAMCFEHAKLAG